MAELVALAQVILVDLVLAGDNAIVVGIAVAGLPVQQRWRVMVLGIAAATVLRIVFASFTVQLLQDHRLAARRRPAAALGLLEALARAAQRAGSSTCRAGTRRARSSAEAATPEPTARAAEDDASGRHADHRGRRLDVARQRARRRRRRARARLGADLRARVVGRVHGSRGGRDRAAPRRASTGSPTSASRSFFYVALRMIFDGTLELVEAARLGVLSRARRTCP